MATMLVLVASGQTSAIQAVGPNMSIFAGPQVLGGTVAVYTGPTPNGPWSLWSPGVSLFGASARLAQTGYCYLVTATQAGILAISDIGAGQGSNPLNEPIVNCNAVIATPNATAETALFSFRVPPLFLKPNFRMALRATASFTNNANAKTLQVRMNGLTGTLCHQSAALASLANYAFEADWVGIGDGATLKGLGAGSAGGYGTSTTALTTLARDYINNETEFVVSATKATGTDTFQLDSLQVSLFQ